MPNIINVIASRLQAHTETRVTAAPEGATEFQTLLKDMSKTFGPAKNTGNSYVWLQKAGKCELRIWVYEPKNGMVKGRVELITPFTEIMEKLDTESGSGYIRVNFGEGKISDFKKRVLAHLKNESTAQQKDIAEDQKSLKFIDSFK